MEYKYRNLLPNYLGGYNINNHAQNITLQDQTIDDQITLLSLWNILDRPILIQKDQQTEDIANFNIICHLVNDDIKTITVNGDITDTISFSEEDHTTDYTYSFTRGKSEDSTQYFLINPNFTVTLETYDGHVYEKGYPENNSRENNVYDHDEFLDKIGTLFNVPRAYYVPYSVTVGSKAYPPFFGKIIHHAGMGVSVMACTEDDYYYVKRLKYFIEHFTDAHYPELMLSLIYHVPLGEIEFHNLYSDICKMDIDVLNEKYMQIGKYNTTAYTYVIPREFPVNIGHHDIRMVQELVNAYMPVTRTVMLRQKSYQIATVRTNTNFDNENLKICFILEDEQGERITNKTVQLDFNGDGLKSYRTNDKGVVEIEYYTLEAGDYPLRIVSPADDFYLELDETKTITINHTLKTSITNALWRDVVDNVKLQLFLKDENDNPLPNRQITLNFNLLDAPASTHPPIDVSKTITITETTDNDGKIELGQISIPWYKVAGSWTIEAIYNGEHGYYSSNLNFTSYVEPHINFEFKLLDNVAFSANALCRLYGIDNRPINVGDVDVYVDDYKLGTYTVTNVDDARGYGFVFLDLSNFGAGDYNIRFYFPEQDSGAETEYTTSITLIKIETSLTMTLANVNYEEQDMINGATDNSINIHLEGAKEKTIPVELLISRDAGYIDVIFDETETVDKGGNLPALTLGTGNTRLKLGKGTYYATAIFHGDKYRTATQVQKTLELETWANLTAELTSNYIDNTSIKVKLTDPQTNTAFADETITISTNKGATATGVTDSNGEATIPISLAVGSNIVLAKWDGNNIYATARKGLTCNIIKRDTSIAGKITNNTSGQVLIQTTVTDNSLGDAMTTGTIYADVDGTRKDVRNITPSNKGTETLQLNLGKGNYSKIVIGYIANDKYNSSSYTFNNVTVTGKEVTLTIKENSVPTVIGDNIDITVTATNNDGYAIGGITIRAVLGISTTGDPTEQTTNITTDDNGQANYSYTTTETGTYGIIFEYDGNYIYYATSTTNKLYTITKYETDFKTITATPNRVIIGDSTEITINLQDTSKNNPVASVPITLTITNKDYNTTDTATVTTNEDGTATYDFTPTNYGYYSVKAEYSGNELYKATSKTAENLFTYTSLSVSTNIGLYDSNGNSISSINCLEPMLVKGGVMPEDNTNLSPVTIEVTDPDGNITERTGQVSSNKYSVNINSSFLNKAGTWKFKAKTSAIDRYNASESSTVNLTVNKIDSFVRSNATADEKGNITVEVQLSYYATGTINLINGNVLLNSATLENGKATLTTKVNSNGDYTFTLGYVGNDIYNSFEVATNTVNVSIFTGFYDANSWSGSPTIDAANNKVTMNGSTVAYINTPFSSLISENNTINLTYYHNARDRRKAIGLYNPDTTNWIGYATPSPQGNLARAINEETRYLTDATVTDMNIWMRDGRESPLSIEYNKTDNSLIFTYTSQNGTENVQVTVPLGTVDISTYYLAFYDYKGLGMYIKDLTVGGGGK